MSSLVRVQNLSKHFPVTAGLLHRTIGTIKAVDDVTLNIAKGEILGVVGESGCGKSTLARLILRLIEPTSGKIFFDNQNIYKLDRLELRHLRRKMQMVFQDPYSALDPRYSTFRSLAEIYKIQQVEIDNQELKDRIAKLLVTVGLKPEHSNVYPHQLSGGQKQRVVIARALALTPEFVILDEPTAALDVSVQAQVILLLQQLREKFNLTYLFISHDLALVDYFCNRVVVMYLGRVVEILPANKVSTTPRHPYTKALADSVFVADPAARKDAAPIEGEVSSPFDLPNGCVFEARCPNARNVCRKTAPILKKVGEDEYVACYFPLSD
ncbi:MAG: ABC transporter ATP-binding protein [Desulfobacterales bacterium]